MRINYLHNHAFALAASLLGMAATSCQEDDTVSEDLNNDQTRSVMFNIPLSAQESALNDLQIFLYDTTGAEKLAQVEITSIEEQTGGSQMVHGLIPASNAAINGDMLDCHMVILGNCPETDGSVKSLQRLVFDANCSAMPMVGAHSVQTRMDRKLEVLCPVTDMLRSAALVTVCLSDELKASGITLKEARLEDVNQTGYCTPLEATQLNTSANLTTSLVFNPDIRFQGDVALEVLPDGTLQGIIPECATPADGPLQMHLGLMRDGVDYTGAFGQTLYFKNYADNMPFDIVRNHHYIFTIRSLQTEGALEVKVEDWEQKTAEDVIFK